MIKNTTDFASLITSYLTEYLPYQRNYSKNTILSYRDTFKLFVKYLTEYKQLNLRKFTMKHFDRLLIIEFLEWLRNNGSSVSTVNQRLAAIKSFAQYAGVEHVEYLASLQNIQGIRSAKTVTHEINYLDTDQTELLINRPDINDTTGLRHRAILTILYDTGCRVQELCDLKIKDVNIKASTIHLYGKGNKHRTVLVSVNTSRLIDEYIKRQRYNSDTLQPLLVNKNQTSLTRGGVQYIINKYVKEIRMEDPSFPEKTHCHCLRHSKAMHMLAAGINIVYIRDFLGHEDISTTMIYVKADNRIKNDVINKLVPKITHDSEFPDWTKDTELLKFLNSLG